MSMLIKYKRYFLTYGLFITIGLLSLYCQTRTNPFEVKQRLSSLPKSTEVSSLTDTTKTIVLDTSIQKINGDTSNAISQKGSVTSDKIANPFEVDHVPLRKTIVNKRLENINIQVTKSKDSKGFVLVFLLISCALLAIVLNTKSKSIGLIARSIFNENMLKLLHREESTKLSSYLVLLYIIFILNISIYTYLLLGHYNGPQGILIFLGIALGFSVLYVIKHFGLFIVGNIFMVTKNTQLYSFAVMLFNAFVGLCLIPINFMIAFGPENFKEIIILFSFGFIAILILLRTIRGIFIVSDLITERLFQIFIYLCTFEIAPVLILVKTVIKWGLKD